MLYLILFFQSAACFCYQKWKLNMHTSFNICLFENEKWHTFSFVTGWMQPMPVDISTRCIVIILLNYIYMYALCDILTSFLFINVHANFNSQLLVNFVYFLTSKLCTYDFVWKLWNKILFLGLWVIFKYFTYTFNESILCSAPIVPTNNEFVY